MKNSTLLGLAILVTVLTFALGMLVTGVDWSHIRPIVRDDGSDPETSRTFNRLLGRSAWAAIVLVLWAARRAFRNWWNQ